MTDESETKSDRPPCYVVSVRVVQETWADKRAFRTREEADSLCAELRAENFDARVREVPEEEAFPPKDRGADGK